MITVGGGDGVQGQERGREAVIKGVRHDLPLGINDEGITHIFVIGQGVTQKLVNGVQVAHQQQVNAASGYITGDGDAPIL